MTPAMQVLMREVERVWDDFWAAVHERADVEAAAALLGEAATVVNMPAMTGGNDPGEVRTHLAGVAAALPAGLRRHPVSRTVDTRGLVDEVRLSFVHDRELPWLLPGVPASGREVRVLAISVVAVRQARIASVRTLWDDARLRAQVRAG